jgi:hypothetical protein
VKKLGIEKRPGKDITNVSTSVVVCDDPPHEELDVHKSGNNDDIFSCNFICLHRLMHIYCVVPTNGSPRSKPKTEEQKEARWARDRLNYAKMHPIKKEPGKKL